MRGLELKIHEWNWDNIDSSPTKCFSLGITVPPQCVAAMSRISWLPNQRTSSSRVPNFSELGPRGSTLRQFNLRSQKFPTQRLDLKCMWLNHQLGLPAWPIISRRWRVLFLLPAHSSRLLQIAPVLECKNQITSTYRICPEKCLQTAPWHFSWNLYYPLKSFVFILFLSQTISDIYLNPANAFKWAMVVSNVNRQLFHHKASVLNGWESGPVCYNPTVDSWKQVLHSW